VTCRQKKKKREKTSGGNLPDRSFESRKEGIKAEPIGIIMGIEPSDTHAKPQRRSGGKRSTANGGIGGFGQSGREWSDNQRWSEKITGSKNSRGKLAGGGEGRKLTGPGKAGKKIGHRTLSG